MQRTFEYYNAKVLLHFLKNIITTTHDIKRIYNICMYKTTKLLKNLFFFFLIYNVVSLIIWPIYNSPFQIK